MLDADDASDAEDADDGDVGDAGGVVWWSGLLAAHIPMVEIEPSAGAACTAWIIAVDLNAKTSTGCCIYLHQNA